jgi:hypothetical protein
LRTHLKRYLPDVYLHHRHDEEAGKPEKFKLSGLLCNCEEKDTVVIQNVSGCLAVDTL